MRRPSIRMRVQAIPVLPMVNGGAGHRIDLRVVQNGDGLFAIMGLDDEGRQWTASREPVEDPVDLVPYFCEAVKHLRREK